MDTATKAIAAEAAEKKMQKRTGAAYSKALTSTEEKTEPKAGAGQGTRGTDAGEMGKKWYDMFK